MSLCTGVGHAYVHRVVAAPGHTVDEVLHLAVGKSLTTARAVGQRLGIDEVHGEVKPADQLKLVEKLQSEGRSVAMNSAQQTLVKGDLRGIATA